MDFFRQMCMFASKDGLLWMSIFKNGSIIGNMDFCGCPFLKMDPFLEIWTFVDVQFWKYGLLWMDVHEIDASSSTLPPTVIKVYYP